MWCRGVGGGAGLKKVPGPLANVGCAAPLNSVGGVVHVVCGTT